MKPQSNIALTKFYALAFGLFLGLCIWKFGNPVILDHVVVAPATGSDWLNDAWPPHWAGWVLAPLAAWGALLVFQGGSFKLPSSWLWVLPLGWLGWQFLAATQTVDAGLTGFTLWQFCGCVTCYFLGALLLAHRQVVGWLWIGVLAAFAFCLVRAVDQRVYEYPQNFQALTEGERVGWTNFPPAAVAEMKSQGIILLTNGMEAANPLILAKFAKGRVSGTLVYPNALAELILLLWPVSLALAFSASRQLRPSVRLAAVALTVFLGGASFFWSGSKLGWLIGIVVLGLALLRLDWPKQLKLAAVAAVLVLGLGVFALRFHHYFAAGATSAGARFDYWRAAAQTTAMHPWMGTGPGTFQRPYALLKSPQSEMARLVHNDYLEQFSDSGIPGGLAYTAWILFALTSLGRKLWRSDGLPPPRSDSHRGQKAAASKFAKAPGALLPNPQGDGQGESGRSTISLPAAGPASSGIGSKAHFPFAIFLGLLGWFAQGLGEFGLFVPALAWTAFTLLGCLIGQAGGDRANS